MNNILELKIVLAKPGELSVICTHPTILALAWASGRVLMANPELVLFSPVKMILSSRLEDRSSRQQGPQACLDAILFVTYCKNTHC